MEQIKNLFYCPQCKKHDNDLTFDKYKEKDKITWSNPRDGWGRPLTHIVCPDCGYELAAFMRCVGMLKYENDRNNLIAYVKDVIKGYSDGTFCDSAEILKKIKEERSKKK